MAYSDISSDFSGILNRNDNTAALTQLFVTQAMNRIVRETQGRLYYLENQAKVEPPFGQSVVSANPPLTIAAGGSSYPVSATFNLTFSGGTTASGFATAEVSVTTNASGVVTTINGVVGAGGRYSSLPSSPAATAVVGGLTGSGCTINFTALPAPFNRTPVPSDLLAVIDLITPDYWGTPKPLKHLPHRLLLSRDPTNWPTWYSRYNGVFYWAGVIPYTQTLTIHYYGQPTALAVDGGGNYTNAAHNELTDNCPDLVTYGALTFAADYFQLDQKQVWEQQWALLRDAELAKTVNLEFEGGPMQMAPAYGCEAADDTYANIYPAW